MTLLQRRTLMNLSKDSGGRLLAKLNQFLMRMMIWLHNMRNQGGLHLRRLIEAKRVRYGFFI